MWFGGLLKRFRKPTSEDSELSLDRGLYYFYMIITLQIMFVFGIAAVLMGVGQVLATPWWVFLFAVMFLVGGCAYIYRKAKQKLRWFKEALKKVDLSQHNCEISIMGGMLTMRVEHNNHRLLEAPPSAPPVLQAKSFEPPPTAG